MPPKKQWPNNRDLVLAHVRVQELAAAYHDAVADRDRLLLEALRTQQPHQVAQQLGVTAERVRQIRRRANNKTPTGEGRGRG